MQLDFDEIVYLKIFATLNRIAELLTYKLATPGAISHRQTGY